MADPYPLQHFIDAQQGVYEHALAELQAGQKRSHWMWFIFPQIDGLGRSDMARRYAISGAAHAQAYLAHPLLGPRLIACSEALLAHAGRPAVTILGNIDALKLHSSMTLFARCAPPQAPFEQVLACFYQGAPDARTLFALRA
ncbi:DUF1810 domain-containing protein [Pseudomonas typographi]|uniref:DUF1810 domain-containing protein n=1 Tax=Pseudomonas typographi TaxID=2715964 RepID=A0ABR7Z5N9_9PSED|nr:DUF1810 domain-containing protein [Pseudomonas typographi]MBD1554177.1 DUF1810 domain-containing protein [Pseudomonas typographi]MBD1589461.1 DUF1810 domain-containing protein [Pseudomonas typographi]MBD1600683.1 DUF1810 domain-containing protein [Pseudomonas typographi]